MNPNYRSQDVDGFEETKEQCLSRNRQEAQILHNQSVSRDEIYEKIENATKYGTSSDAQNITSIVLEMINNDCFRKLVLKSQIIWNVDSINEAITEACIQLGIGDDDFSGYVTDKGNEIDITLV